MNDPAPKGGYQAILEIVQLLGENGPQTPLELVPELSHYGYRIKEENGRKECPALTPGNYTHIELCGVLGFAEEDGDKLKLTEDSEALFDIDTSGQRVYEILTSDMPEKVKRAELSSLILLKLSRHNIDTQQLSIPNAFHTFFEQLWSEENKDQSTGRYQTLWNLDQVETELSTDWNKEKLRH